MSAENLGAVLRLSQRRCHLSDVFVLLVLLCCWTSVSCYPANSKLKMDNPCKVNKSETCNSTPIDKNSKEAKTLYGNIVRQTSKAMSYNDELVARYVDEVFKDDNVPRMFHTKSYDWLPKLPDPTSPEIDKVTIEETLRTFFTYLQSYAIALEQVLDDQVKESGDFIQDISDVQGHLRTLRCEIHTAIIKLCVTTNPDASEDLMTQEFRKMENPLARHVRDYLIIRDYGKALHYLHIYFKKHQV